MLCRPVAHYTVGIRSRKPTSHFTIPWVHSRANRIIVHPLYGYVKPLGCACPTSTMRSIHIFGSPVARYRLGVRFRNVASHFPPHADHSHANRIIVHHLNGSVQLPGNGPLTSSIGSVHIKGISIAPYAQVCDPENAQATSPHHTSGSLMLKPHYHAPAVRICTVT